MKIHTKLAALCAFQQWTEIAAFTVPSPTKTSVRPSFALRSTLGPPPDAELRIEGKTRRTWQFSDISREVVELNVRSEGRPMHNEIELWIGPDWTPLMIKAYSEDGQERPIRSLVGTRNRQAKIEVRNVGTQEFPVSASAVYAEPPMEGMREELPSLVPGKYIEGGGAVHTQVLTPGAEMVQVLLNTDTKQLNAKVELLCGPNNIKQFFEVFTNNGVLNALYVELATPGTGHTVRVTNIAPLEFPCRAYIAEA